MLPGSPVRLCLCEVLMSISLSLPPLFPQMLSGGKSVSRIMLAEKSESADESEKKGEKIYLQNVQLFCCFFINHN